MPRLRPDGQLLSEWIDSDGDGAADATQAIVYDDEGRIVRSESWNSDGGTTVWEYEFDDAGNPTVATQSVNGEVTSRRVSDYSCFE